MKPLRFVHAADLHLDSPFKGLTGLPKPVGERVKESTFAALDRLVRLAVREQADFVLVSGDVYDLADRSLRAQLRFAQAAERLAEAGIRLLVVHGNHDPLDGARANLAWPDSVVFFGGEAVETIDVTNRAGERIATVSGISYAKSATADNLALRFPKPAADVYAIAMLHTNVDGQPGHDNYAPCTKEQLAQAGYHYWALGHVHARRVLHEHPHIVYPGNLQGRSVKETGAKGCYLVEVDETGHTALRFHETTAVRWAHKELPIDGWSDEQQLRDGIEQAMQAALDESAGQGVMLRITLTGRGPLHGRLQHGSSLQELVVELQAESAAAAEWSEAAGAFVWLESCRVATGSDLPLGQLLAQDSFVGDLLRMAEQLALDEDALRAFCAEAFQPLMNQGKPARLLRDLDAATLKQWLIGAGELAVDELIGGDFAGAPAQDGGTEGGVREPMRFRQLYMNGFGLYANRTFELDPAAPAVLFLGRNEAGKSTVMGFIRAMLFGFPTRANMPERYEPLRGGLHGGALTMSDAGGRTIRLERYERKLRSLFEDGSEAGEASLQALLGGMTADVYRNVFAFGLSELQKLETLRTDEVGAFLFSSGMGLSGNAIVQAERKLAARMEQLYKPRGTKQDVNVWLKEIEAGEAELRRSKEQMGRFGERRAELAALEEAIRRCESGLGELASEREWLAKCKQSRPAWLRLREVERELAALPAPAGLPDWQAFPEDALVRLERLLDEKERLLERRDLLAIERDEAAARREAHPPDERLLGHRSDIAYLLEAAPVYQENMARSIELAKELESEQAEFARHLRQIDPSWTIDQLKRFPISIAERERIADYARRFQALQAGRALRQAERERLAAGRDALRGAAEADRERLRSWTARRQAVLQDWRGGDRAGAGAGSGEGEGDPDELEAAVRRCWEALRSDGIELHHATQRLAEAEGGAGRPGASRTGAGRSARRGGTGGWAHPFRLAAVLVVAAGGVLAAWLWLGADRLPAALVVLGLAVAVGAAFIARHSAERRAGREREQRTAEWRREVSLLRGRCEQHVRQLASLLPVSAEPLAAYAETAAGAAPPFPADAKALIGQLAPVIARFEQQLASLRKLDAEIAQARYREEASARAWAQWRREEEELLERERLAASELAQWQAQWEDGLRAYRLPSDLTPDTVLMMGQYAEQALQSAERMFRAEAKQTAILELNASFEQSADALLAQLGLGGGSLVRSDLLLALKRIGERLEQQLQLRDQARQLEEKESACKQELEAVAESVRRTEEKLSELYAQASAAGEAELRHGYARYRQAVEWLQEKRHLEMSVFHWIKPDQARQLEDTLETLDAARLEERLLEAERGIASLEDELNELKDRRGRLRGEIERMSEGTEHAALLQLQQERLAGFEQAAARWMQLALSAALIRKAKEMYERERQPGVLQQASRYFAGITGGRYTRVISRLGEKSIFAQKDNGELLDAAFLSRGTAEQLYLAMRLALADEYAKTVTLPIVMDDIFVNFDRARLEQTLSVMKDAASRRQLLLFTCHEHVAEAVQAALPGTQLIALHT